jgi:hypothetical protein
MQYHDGFLVTYTRADGKALKAYVPPCWMLTGAERKQAEAQERAKRRPGRLARYVEALQQRKLL